MMNMLAKITERYVDEEATEPTNKTCLTRVRSPDASSIFPYVPDRFIEWAVGTGTNQAEWNMHRIVLAALENKAINYYY